MKTIFKFLIALVSFSFIACDDAIQIKLDEGSKLYVIDAFVNSLDTTQTIRITTSDNYFSNRSAPAVPNAQVVLKDLTTNVSYSFQYTSNGNYVFMPQDSMAKVNHQYELNVIIDGYTYTSLLLTQPRAAGIDSLYDLDFSQFGDMPENQVFIALAAKDKVDKNTDYYWLKTYRNDTSLFNAGNISLTIDGTGGAVTEAQGLDSLSFTPPAVYLGLFNKGDLCRVEIHSISRDTYYFLQQVGAQVNNGGLFATTPENVKTNIITPSGATTKAVGWFSMATVASKSIVAQ